MAKHRNKIIVVTVIAAALAGAWFFGGNYGKGGAEAPPDPIPSSMETTQPSETALAVILKPALVTEYVTITPAIEAPEAKPTTPAGATPTQEPAIIEVPTTESVAGSKPAPVEPQDATLGDGSFTVTLSVRCDTILDNMNLLNKEKHELVPTDGVIFPATVVTAYEGESVFNVLQREMKRAGIHMEFRNTPIYNSTYIMGINNLYEFDAGELSGWMYRVDGWFPNYGCSRYQLQPGDVVEWVYTSDLGRDVGEYWLGGNQEDE